MHENFERMAELKKQVRMEAQADDIESKDGDDGDRYEEEGDMGRDSASKGRRNLRIREDTAKYLVNLDLESAKYDPKTRSMIGGDPIPESTSGNAADDGFVQSKDLDGDAAEFAHAQKYAWEVEERTKNSGHTAGGDDEASNMERIHLQANPTAAAIAIKREAAEQAERESTRRKELLDKYGDQDTYSIEKAPAAALPESSEYVEYDEDGRVLTRNGQDVKLLEAARPVAKSRYAEDVMINNHTSVFGSWWHEFSWGYQCCYSTIRSSYCQGELGRKSFLATHNKELLEGAGTKRGAPDFEESASKRANVKDA